MLNKLDIVLKRIIFLLVGGAVLYLLLLSVFGTSSAGSRNFARVAGKEEIEGYNYCLSDTFWMHIIVICIFILLMYLIVYWLKPIGKGKININQISLRICIVYFTIGTLLILFTQFHPVSDSAKILEIAEQFEIGNYTEFRMNEGYLWRYPDQLGIIFFYYIITLMFGNYNYLAIQFINLFAATIMGIISQKVSNMLWGENWFRAIGVEALYFVFSPLLFYVTYVYGTILGVCFSMLAIYMEIKFLKKRKLLNSLYSAIFIGLAVVFKTNSMIMFVAMFIFLVYDLIMEKEKKKTAIGIVILLSVQIFFTQGIQMFISNKSGMEISKGMPKLAWVAMGLQENRLAPGTWNGYSVSLYEEANYNYEKANDLALESIKNSVKGMWEDKSQAVLFFGKKMAFQWNDPFWGMNEMIRGRRSDIHIASFVDKIINGKINYFMWFYLNFLQTIILMGGMFYILLCRTKEPRENSIMFVSFLGGFIFHIFWEAKREYVLPYFLMIFPYSVQGYFLVIEKLHILIKKEYKIAKNKLICLTCGAAICVILFISIYPTRMIQYTVAVHDTLELCTAYQETLRENAFRK